MFFDKFVRRVEIRGSLLCVTAVRVGAGKTMDAGSSDLPVLKGPSGVPLIPGASLKGVLRSSVEAAVRGLMDGSSGKSWTCNPLGDPCFKDGQEAGQGGEHGKSARDKAEDRRKKLEKELCLVCRTFGAAGLASHVAFSDAPALAGFRVERRDGVAIDRDLGRVAGDRKYDFETVAAGSRFDMRIVIDSADDWQEGLLVLGLDLLDQGFSRIGGATSRGLGQMRPEIASVVETRSEHLLAGSPPEKLEWESYRAQKLAALRERLALATRDVQPKEA